MKKQKKSIKKNVSKKAVVKKTITKKIIAKKTVAKKITKKDIKRSISPTVLIVLDGWGYRTETTDNAISSAKKPFYDSIWANPSYPHLLIEASGLHVGLPEGQMGNSEIGHTTIGAGKVIDTDLVRIKKAIDDGSFAKNPAFLALFENVKKAENAKKNSSGSSKPATLHIQALLGNGGVHAHDDHLYAFLRAAKDAGIDNIALHIFTDGRDTAPQSAGSFMKNLEKIISDVGVGFIATVSGRFYAMDRDNNWNRLEKAEKAIFECKGNVCHIKPSEKLEEMYKAGALDEHIEPIVFANTKNTASTKVTNESEVGCPIKDGDSVLFLNFRADRARMLTSKILEKQAKEMPNLCFATLTEYSKEYNCLVAFPPISIEATLAGEISASGKSQSHIAETEKFPHATYFINGGREKPHENEKHIMLESRKDVPTHDLAPKMRAEGIADKAIEEINKGGKNGTGVDFIFINFANPDMVGHTANVPAIIEAIEEVDKQLKRVCDAVIAKGGVAIITADHGNAEVNRDAKTGEKHTSHTINPVPVVVLQSPKVKPQITLIKKSENKKNKNHTEMVVGGLSDLAPTVLYLMGIKAHKTMTGKKIVK